MLLAEARKALGGDDKISAIKRLQISGTFLRSTGPDQVIDGDFDVFIELPDKYRRDEITGFAGANVERTEALNGTEVWDNSSGGLTAVEALAEAASRATAAVAAAIAVAAEGAAAGSTAVAIPIRTLARRPIPHLPMSAPKTCCAVRARGSWRASRSSG
jgi:hypothetical protein